MAESSETPDASEAPGRAPAPAGSAGSAGGAAPGEAAHTARMILVVLALAAGFVFVPRVTQSCNASSTNEPAPDFTANVIANPPEAGQKAITLSALRGRPVILDFWATWCGPCQAEAPIVNGIATRFKDKGLVVVGVNTSDAQVLAEAFVKKKGLTFPVVFDEGNDVAHKFHVENLPTLIVVSKEGKVHAVRHGITSDSDLERLVRQVL